MPTNMHALHNNFNICKSENEQSKAITNYVHATRVKILMEQGTSSEVNLHNLNLIRRDSTGITLFSAYFLSNLNGHIMRKGATIFVKFYTKQNSTEMHFWSMKLDCSFLMMKTA